MRYAVAASRPTEEQGREERAGGEPEPQRAVPSPSPPRRRTSESFDLFDWQAP